MDNKKMAIKKKEKFDVTKAVKAAARATLGTVPPTRSVPDAKTRQQKRATKHKPKLVELISLDE